MHPEKHWNTEINAQLCAHIFWLGHKNTQMKIFDVYPTEQFWFFNKPQKDVIWRPFLKASRGSLSFSSAKGTVVESDRK